MLKDGSELALLDLQEEGAYARGHLFYAASAPLSRIEFIIETMIPRKTTRIILIDGGNGLSERAYHVLGVLGYKNLSIMSGGNPAWENAGYVLFSGVHVPSKAFGEFVEHHYKTPRIEAIELKKKLDEKANIIILDSRPIEEYRSMNIPTGTNCPGAEIAYRIHDIVPDTDAQVIVNCAGRTRSIIGAQSLLNANFTNTVAALKDGTMGWVLAGYELEKQQNRRASSITPKGLELAKDGAKNIQDRFGVKTIDIKTLIDFKKEENERTLYVFDVRNPEEYAENKVANVANIPGGQLIQETEVWATTLGARIVLVDNNGVRATLTASWLIQMGWEATILEGGLETLKPLGDLFQNVKPVIPENYQTGITPAALKNMLKEGDALLMDFGKSRDYQNGHIPQAWWAVRARLQKVLLKLPKKSKVIFTSPNGSLASLAANDATNYITSKIFVLEGGTDAWKKAGFELESGLTNIADEIDDTWLKPYDTAKDMKKSMRSYLTWETDLLHEIERDGDHRFKFFKEKRYD